MYRSPFKAKAKRTTPFKKKGNWKAGYHTGEDWVCDNTVLVSPASGIVSYVSSFGSYGNHLIIHTDDGNSILMAHMKNKPMVKKGQRVSKGQQVGIMGSTGNSTGPHLHIEVEKGTDWNYNKNLLKPSAYIDFNDYGKEVFEMPKEWVNGSTREYVYEYTARCKRQSQLFTIGYIEPYEKCKCYGKIDDCYLVVYDTSLGKKTGFVKYAGGIK